MEEEFKPINSQEEFDAAVTARYGDVAGLQGQIQTLTGERDRLKTANESLTGEIDGYKVSAMKSRIAREMGIPQEMEGRLSGETEAEIRADAEALAKSIKAVKGPAPMFQPGTENGGKNANLITMLHELRGE